MPFTSERKLMSSIETDAARQGRINVVTKGAPDVLLHRCRFERVGSGEVPLDEQRRRAIVADIERLSEQALRTLGVAYRRLPDTAVPDSDGPEAQEALERELVYAGLVGIIDPPRPEAAAAIAEARRAGVRTIMITGDHPRTAGRIAASLGLVAAGEPVATGVELDQQDEEQLRRTVREVSVYARVAPQHKLRIVDALQANGAIVAMTGDGVNDAPALKSADIGVAMGITGTEVTKEAAKMILADDNFATIVAALREGRLIFANIRKFLRYLLSSNIGEVLTVFLGVVAAPVIGLERQRRHSRRSVAGHPDPVDQPAHRHRAGARAGGRPAGGGCDGAAAAVEAGADHRPRDAARRPAGRPGDGRGHPPDHRRQAARRASSPARPA